MQLAASGDTIELQKIEGDAQLVYQEMNLVQQKGARASNQYLQQGKIYTDKVTDIINRKASELNLTFVMPKQKRFVHNPYGFEILLDSPLYFAGEAIDITTDLIKALAVDNADRNFKTTTKTTSKK